MSEGRRGDGYFRRRWIIKAFNRDLIVASMIGASFNPTSLFAPMVERRRIAPERDGNEALGVIAPNVGALPWEAVIEFREHNGSVQAWAMLREFEEKATREEPEDASAFLRSIEREVREALFAAHKELRPSWPKKIAVEALKTAVGIVPFYGQIAGPALSAAEMGGEWIRDRRSWVAALMILRR